MITREQFLESRKQYHYPNKNFKPWNLPCGHVNSFYNPITRELSCENKECFKTYLESDIHALFNICDHKRDANGYCGLCKDSCHERIYQLKRRIMGEPELKDTNPKDVVGSTKVPISTVPAPVKYLLGLALLEGSCKYGRHNYRVLGVRSSIYYDAVMRHIDAWWEGEDIDPDSGLPHLAKAMACCTILLDAEMRSKLEDDRPPKTLGFIKEYNDKAKELISKFDPETIPKAYTEKEHPSELIYEIKECFETYNDNNNK